MKILVCVKVFLEYLYIIHKFVITFYVCSVVLLRTFRSKFFFSKSYLGVREPSSGTVTVSGEEEEEEGGGEERGEEGSLLASPSRQGSYFLA